MALRFRKSIKLAPGVRWNVSGGGSSWTFGPRGASIGVGKRGTFLNTGIPGTGLSSRTRLSTGNLAATPRAQSALAAPSAPQTERVALTCSVRDDGDIVFTDRDGQPASDEHIAIAKGQGKDQLRELIAEVCEQINSQIESLDRIHVDTPDPKVKPRFQAPEFTDQRPKAPGHRPAKWWERLIPGRVASYAETYDRAVEIHDEEVREWDLAKKQFDLDVAHRRALVEVEIYRDPAAMEKFLEMALQDVTWPRETDVAFEIKNDGALVALDVDLPEIEDMPTRLAAVPARGLRLSIKELSGTRIQKMYMAHIHGIAFRLIGETFAALPVATEVVLSAYSQRRSATTGQVSNEYLLSVRAQRSEWEKIDFDHLSSVDVVEALTQCELRRTMSKSGVFKAIEPWEA